MKKSIFCCCFGMMISSSTIAELNVIADLGGESAIRFYEGIQPEIQGNAQIMPNTIPQTISEVDMLPVVSHKLTPGRVQPISLDLSGMSPIFLLGTDPLSVEWLHQNYRRLLEQQAVGLVVNVATMDELEQLRSFVPNLPLLPASADDLSERLNLRHYPALITQTGVSQ